MMIKTQIAHFFTDDKFYDSAINLFNTLEDYDSAYYIISKNKDCLLSTINGILI